MPKGYAKIGINKGWFKKGYQSETQFKKGHIPWNENKKCSNISKSLSGKKLSDKHKMNISIGKKGIKVNYPKNRKGHITSDKTKIKIGNANKGEKNGMFGKENKWGYHTKKSIIKIKEKRKLQITPSKDTTIEVKIQNFLKQLRIEYFTHQYMKIEHGYQCDILIPSLNLVIECDGDYWHKYPVGRDIDHIRTSELLQKGFKVLRLWENEIKLITIKQFEKKLNDKN